MLVMKKPVGLSLEIGINSEWWPSLLIYRQKLGRLRAKVPEAGPIPNAGDDSLKTFAYFGLKVDLNFGTWRWPVNHWSWPPWYPKVSRWNSGKHWFVMTIPFFPGLYISSYVGNKKMVWGFYLGCKTYMMNKNSTSLINETGNHWPEMAWGRKEELGNFYIVPTGTLRNKDRIYEGGYISGTTA